MNRRQLTLQIAMQLGVMSILTLLTVMVFTHIATMLLFRRLVMGKRKRPGTEAKSGDEFHVPLRSSLGDAASLEDDEDRGFIQRRLSQVRRVWSGATLMREGVTREVYVRYYRSTPDAEKILLLCNPSGETVDSLWEKASKLAEACGFDALVMFDYRPTGKSCKGIVAPDAKTMLEDAESVLQWLRIVQGVDLRTLSVAGISLGGLQAMRLAVHHQELPRLLLINTFASFSCILGSTITLLPGILRIGGTGGFLADATPELLKLRTRTVAVVSVEVDQRVPTRCTNEMLTAIMKSEATRVMHVQLKGTHSDPIVDHNSMETLREFLEL